MAQPIKILSVDGGGARGLIPAMLLARVEQLTGKPVAEIFDLLAGTSTGGILVLGLAMPGPDGLPRRSAAEMVSLYETETRRIFHRSAAWKFRALGGLAEERYRADGIESVLEEYFGDARLKDALSDVLITSYETERRIPFFFKSRAARLRPDYDFPMKWVARATSAAPTYFEPSRIEAGSPRDYYSLLDGGLYANNPAMCAYVEAKTLHPDCGDFLVVSLGTGERMHPLRYEDVRGWGLARWAQPILSVVLDAASTTVDYQLRHLLRPAADGSRRYWRFQVNLTGCSDAMDDVRPENLRALRLLAESLIRQRADDLESLAALLVA
ncbi:MAG: patatin-like phospholipase family protein [Bryobacteraceae bacterium]